MNSEVGVDPHHDPLLFAVAIMIAISSTMLSQWLFRRARSGDGSSRTLWLTSASVISGFGIWSAAFSHLISMHHNTSMSLDGWLSALSLLCACAIAGISFSIVTFSNSRITRIIGGATYGIGIICSHFVISTAVGEAVDVTIETWLAVGGIASVAFLSVVAFTFTASGRSTISFLTGNAFLVLALYANEIYAHFATKLTLTADLLTSGMQLERQSVIALLIASVAIYPTVLIVAKLLDRTFNRNRQLEANRLRTLANISIEGLMIHADGVILHANEAFARIIDIPVDEIIGSSSVALAAPECRENVRRNMAEQSTAPYEIEMLRRDGSRVPVELYGNLIEFQGRKARAVVIKDLSSTKIAEEQIRYLAHHDALTGLPNRALFQDRLSQTLFRARANAEQIAVFSINVNRFKRVNEVYGHATGDTVLHEVAVVLNKVVSESCTLARVGGDEFAIIQSTKSQPEDAASCAEELLAKFDEAFGPDGRDIDIGLSIGISVFPQDGDDVEQLLKCADTGLGRARDEGGSRYRFYESAMDEKLRIRHRLEQDLRTAITEEQLELYYQAQVDIKTGNITGFEALARWNHAERGFISPTEFIPIAEETGLIVSLTDWVLRRACADASEWPSNIRVSVNLSAEQFKREDVVERVRCMLQRFDLAPSRLELEITETVLIDDGEKALITLHKLKALGVRIAMDDFGTGYSSLSYLQRFPFDKIKIDRSFVTGVEQNAGSRAIIRAVTSLGEALGLSVIAEGVETQEEYDVLKEENCDAVQGYLISRPVPVAELPDVMQRQLKRVADEMRSADVTDIGVKDVEHLNQPARFRRQ